MAQEYLNEYSVTVLMVAALMASSIPVILEKYFPEKAEVVITSGLLLLLGGVMAWMVYFGK